MYGVLGAFYPVDVKIGSFERPPAIAVQSRQAQRMPHAESLVRVARSCRVGARTHLLAPEFPAAAQIKYGCRVHIGPGHPRWLAQPERRHGQSTFVARHAFQRTPRRWVQAPTLRLAQAGWSPAIGPHPLATAASHQPPRWTDTTIRQTGRRFSCRRLRVPGPRPLRSPDGRLRFSPPPARKTPTRQRACKLGGWTAVICRRMNYNLTYGRQRPPLSNT